MHFKVTVEDIQFGVRAVSTECPVAKAIQRGTGSMAVFVHTFSETIEVLPSGLMNYEDLVSVEMPNCVLVFTREFDSGVPVCPIEFDLAGPWDAVELVEQQKE